MEKKPLSLSLKIIIGLASLIPLGIIAYTIFVFAAMSLYNRIYFDVLREVVTEADQLLVSQKICFSGKNCSGEVYFFGPTIHGCDVIIYGVKDQETLSSFSKIFMKKFLITPGMKEMSIIAYPLSEKIYSDNLFQRKKRIFTFVAEKD